jgi:hypothetical protein
MEGPKFFLLWGKHFNVLLDQIFSRGVKIFARGSQNFARGVQITKLILTVYLK